MVEGGTKIELILDFSRLQHVRHGQRRRHLKERAGGLPDPDGRVQRVQRPAGLDRATDGSGGRRRRRRPHLVRRVLRRPPTHRRREEDVHSDPELSRDLEPLNPPPRSILSTFIE